MNNLNNSDATLNQANECTYSMSTDMEEYANECMDEKDHCDVHILDEDELDKAFAWREENGSHPMDTPRFDSNKESLQEYVNRTSEDELTEINDGRRRAGIQYGMEGEGDNPSDIEPLNLPGVRLLDDEPSLADMEDMQEIEPSLADITKETIESEQSLCDNPSVHYHNEESDVEDTIKHSEDIWDNCDDLAF